MIPPIEHIIHKRHDKRRQMRQLALVFAICAAILCGWPVLRPPLCSECGLTLPASSCLVGPQAR